ncbi:hypothetical protein QUW15_13890, partial [Desulfovibrio piger]|nr:hypothetical protein [Desulfovibrio piger]
MALSGSVERFTFEKGETRKRQHSAARPKVSGKTALFPRNDRPYGLKRTAFQTENALVAEDRQQGRGPEGRYSEEINGRGPAGRQLQWENGGGSGAGRYFNGKFRVRCCAVQRESSLFFEGERGAVLPGDGCC